MCCKQPPDAEMRCSASFLRDEEIGSFLDTVVDKPVGTLQPLDHLVTDRLPEMRVDLLLRCPVHESKRRDRCAVSQARQLLECLLCVDGQAVQLRDHEVHHSRCPPGRESDRDPTTRLPEHARRTATPLPPARQRTVPPNS